MTVRLEWKSPPRVVVAGQTFAASRTVQRVAAMRALGCAVACVPTTPPGVDYETPPSLAERIRHRLRRPGDPAGANAAVVRAVESGADVLWLDAADMIRAETLRRARGIDPALKVAWYCEDDLMNPRLRTRWLEASLPLIDVCATTKSFNAAPEELPSLGARRTLFVNNSFDPAIHRPVDVDADTRARFGAPVSFVGTFEEPRAESLLNLAKRGVAVRVWGNGWEDWVGRHPDLRVENRPAYNDDYARVIAASAVNLAFLRKANRDLQTCRSVEIPGCGGFMAHERNDEIAALFREGREAVYWSDDDELARLCAFWLDRDAERCKIAEAARDRAFALALTHTANVARILNALVAEPADTRS